MGENSIWGVMLGSNFVSFLIVLALYYWGKSQGYFWLWKISQIMLYIYCFFIAISLLLIIFAMLVLIILGLYEIITGGRVF